MSTHSGSSDVYYIKYLMCKCVCVCIVLVCMRRYSARLAVGTVQAWLDEVKASFQRQFGPEVSSIT
jgi:hypothetical protein